MAEFIDLTGRTIVRWTVLSRAANANNGQTRWLCECECGTKRAVIAAALMRAAKGLSQNASRSCGCLKLEEFRERTTTHGHNRPGHISPTYRSWYSMLSRCRNPNFTRYADYGGRGITVCERWHAFENFLADMGERPTGTSIDRFPNTDGNYEPGNARWATPKEQGRNKRSARKRSGNKRVTFKGKTMCLAEWAEVVGIPATCLSARLLAGWSVNEALTTPPDGNARMLTFNGETHSVREWAELLHVSQVALTGRLSHHWSVERALATPYRKSPS